jgi:hypothetical protein
MRECSFPYNPSRWPDQLFRQIFKFQMRPDFGAFGATQGPANSLSAVPAGATDASDNGTAGCHRPAVGSACLCSTKHSTRPCARLKRLVPFVTSAMTQCRQHADHCPAGAVQQLKCKECSRIGDQREQQRTDGQSPLSKEQERPPTPVVGLTSNPGSHRGNNNQWQDFNADTMREERLFLPDISVTLRQAATLTRCRVGTRTSRRQGQASRNLPQSRAVGSRGPVAHVVMGNSAGATEVNIGGVDASESEKERQSERDDRRNIAWYEKAYPEVTSTPSCKPISDPTIPSTSQVLPSKH